MAPLGQPGCARPRAAFRRRLRERRSRSADQLLSTLQGIRLAGRAAGQQPARLAARAVRRSHRRRVDLPSRPPAGVTPMGRDISEAQLRPRRPSAALGARPVQQSHCRIGPVPHRRRADVRVRRPDVSALRSGEIATEDTFVTFSGDTTWRGERSRIPFHVTSANWQESDRFLAGLMTAFGSPTRAQPLDGAGEFDGVLTGAFRRPRVEGRFRGRAMQRLRCDLGRRRRRRRHRELVRQRQPATITRPRLAASTSTGSSRSAFRAATAARRSTRASGSTAGRWRICSMPSTSRTIRSRGTLSGDFHVYGPYTRPFGFGRMTIDDGTAYRRALRDGDGRAAVRRQRRSPERARNRTRAAARSPAPRSSAGTARIRSTPKAAALAVETLDFAVDAGPAAADRRARFLGQRQRHVRRSRATTSRSACTICSSAKKASARSPVACRCATRCSPTSSKRPRRAWPCRAPAASRSTRQAMRTCRSASPTPRSIRTCARFNRRSRPTPRPPPAARSASSASCTTATRCASRPASSSSICGCSTTGCATRGRSRLRSRARRCRSTTLRLVGDDTALDVTGSVDLDRQALSLQADGAANLAALQGFIPDVRSSGRADVSALIGGTVERPIVSGQALLTEGRLRHFSFPHALEELNGIVTFNASGIRLDGLQRQARRRRGEVRRPGRA